MGFSGAVSEELPVKIVFSWTHSLLWFLDQVENEAKYLLPSAVGANVD